MYKKGTLYVYIKESVTQELVNLLERKIDNIMKRYNIENLVLDTGGVDNVYIESFCRQHNKKYRKKVLVR